MTQPATVTLHGQYGTPATELVECYYAPLLYPGFASDTRRARHCYRNVNGVLVCRNCDEPRP